MTDNVQGSANDSPPLVNVEAEAVVLGGVMIANETLSKLEFLSADDFYEPVHGRVFEKCRELYRDNLIANPVTLKPYFERDEAMIALGGISYLATLTGSSAALIGVIDIARQVRELAALRRIAEFGRQASTMAHECFSRDGHGSANSIVTQLTGYLTEISEITDSQKQYFIEDLTESISDEWEDLANGKQPSGIQIDGFDDWNKVCGVMEDGTLIYLGGRPGMGKSSVAFKVAVGSAKAGHGTGLILLEMNKRSATRRILADEMWQENVTSKYEDLKNGRMTRADWLALKDARDSINQLPLILEDPASMEIESLRTAIRKMKSKLKRRGIPLRLVVIDYLGKFTTAKRFTSTNDRVTYISHQLYLVAREENVIIVCLAQLSRAIEQREDKRPQLADLRDSGSLEQDADTIVFLYREEYYHLRKEPPKKGNEKWNAWADELDACSGQLEIFSAKVREGSLQKRIAWFLSDYIAVRPSSYFRLNEQHAARFDFSDSQPTGGR